ncbi:MAG: 4Fe-4S dicluster domain-containing protein [Treponema sp.]|jgi:Na+-translocating ferredoxin:NAD+ oxidoreductase RnfC subunit|nr:4Fe-4S dicluster domain-containing protein [Treponema sp.]
MYKIALINKKIVKRNLNLKKAQAQEKKKNGKGSWRPLKNYLGKVVLLSSSELIGNETRISNFVHDISKENLLAAIKEADITGMSGNGFPVYKKINTFLSSKSDKKILLINAVECDPALLHDEWLLNNRYAEISQAVHYLTQAFSLERVILAVKNKFFKSDGKPTVFTVPPRYPMGEEHFLIRQAVNIPLDNTEIPAEHGILVLNIQSIYQICKIANKCYDGGRFITIADLTKADARIAYVYPTDNISNLLKTSFGEKGNKHLYKGHGIMLCTGAAETDNFSNHETFAAYSNPLEINNSNKCRRCGSCGRKCPVKIKIAKVVRSVDKNKLFDYSPYRLERCIKCGSCTYFCPASKNVSGYVTELLNNE